MDAFGRYSFTQAALAAQAGRAIPDDKTSDEDSQNHRGRGRSPSRLLAGHAHEGAHCLRLRRSSVPAPRTTDPEVNDGPVHHNSRERQRSPPRPALVRVQQRTSEVIDVSGPTPPGQRMYRAAAGALVDLSLASPRLRGAAAAAAAVRATLEVATAAVPRAMRNLDFNLALEDASDDNMEMEGSGVPLADTAAAADAMQERRGRVRPEVPEIGTRRRVCSRDMGKRLLHPRSRSQPAPQSDRPQQPVRHHAPRPQQPAPQSDRPQQPAPQSVRPQQPAPQSDRQQQPASQSDRPQQRHNRKGASRVITDEFFKVTSDPEMLHLELTGLVSTSTFGSGNHVNDLKNAMLQYRSTTNKILRQHIQCPGCYSDMFLDVQDSPSSYQQSRSNGLSEGGTAYGVWLRCSSTVRMDRTCCKFATLLTLSQGLLNRAVMPARPGRRGI